MKSCPEPSKSVRRDQQGRGHDQSAGRPQDRGRPDAKKGAQDQVAGPSPTDRAKPGTKRSLLTDGAGIPLGLAIAGANRNDSKLVEAPQHLPAGQAPGADGGGPAAPVPGRGL